MKICGAKTYVVANPPPHHGGPYFIFVKLTTDDNLHGFGEVYGAPFAPEKVVHLIDDIVERHVIGANPFQTEKLWRIVYSRGYAQHPDLTLAAVLSGIEIACWDIVGKALGQPIYNLLGGQVHETLRSYTCWGARCTKRSARTPTCTRPSQGRRTRSRRPTSLGTRRRRHKGRPPM